MATQLLFGAGNSVVFGSAGGAGVGNSKGFSKSALSNMQIGDLLVAWLGGQDASPTTVVTGPSGWVRYGAAGGNPSWSASRDSSFWYYPLVSQAAIDSLPSAINWSFSSSVGRAGFVVARATGVDLSAIEDSAATAFNSGSNAASFTVDGIITTNANTLLLGGMHRSNSPNTSVPTCTGFMTDYREYNTTPTSTPTVASTSAVMGYVSLTTAGTTGPYTATFDTVGTSFGGEMVAFKALSSGGTAPGPGPYIVGNPTTYHTAQQLKNFTIDKPSGVQDGDALILALSSQTAYATTDFTCSGWQRISQPFAANSSSYRVIAFYALPVPVAIDISQTDFTFTVTDPSIGGRIAAEMFIVRGAELSYLADGYSPYGGSNGQTVSLYQPNTTVANDLMLAAYNAQFVSGVDYTVSVGPAGMAQQNFLVSSTQNESKTTLAVYQQTVASPGAVGVAALTWNGAAAQSSGATVAIRPAGTAPANSGLDIHYTSATDTLAKAKLFYTSATDTLSTPKEVRIVPNGYSSVTNMLAQSPFYVAHRGGSADWPEMSLHAYTQSVFWGAGAVELSLARTSDGVWFGLHDAYLDRTSLNQSAGTTLNASSMTWAQVQAYQIMYPSNNNPTSLPQPYMRWEEIIDAYYPSHVIFVDPKYAGNYTNELFAMMDALPGTPTDHFVGKSYGVSGNVANTTGWPHDVVARGYQCWGYFYDTDYNNVPTYQGRYTILGMNYNATTPNWTQILSYGKPVMGHIVPNAGAANIALSAGAAGLMVSGVQEVIQRTQNPSQS